MKILKIAGAPISWGVCEVPGWGYQLTPQRVLAEMRDVGLAATELGPEGFLPSDPDELTVLLDSYSLSCVGTFAPVLLHDAGHDPLPDIAGPLDALMACGADVLVLAAATGTDGYDSRPTLDDGQWATLLGNLDRLAAAAAQRGVLAVLQALMGHDRVDSSAAYIHLAPTHVRASYDAARARQRADLTRRDRCVARST